MNASTVDIVDRVSRAVRRTRPRGHANLPPGPSMPATVQLGLWMMRPYPFLEHCRAQYGRTFTLSFPNVPRIVSFSDEGPIREIFTGPSDELYAGVANRSLRPIVGDNSLLLLDGPRHLRERRLLLPPFHGQRMQSYGRVMHEIAARAMDRWPVGRVFTMQHEMQSITFDVILRTIFGIDEGETLRSLRSTLARLIDEVSPITIIPLLQIDLGPHSPWGKFVRGRAEVDRILYRLIDERRRSGDEARDDILSLMLQARYEDGSAMTDVELRDELMTLLAAGHETSATQLSWAFHRVSIDDAIQDRAHAELDALLPGGDEAAIPATELPWIDAIIKESLRVDSVVGAVGRVLQSPRTIGGIDMPKGSLAAVSVYLTHRNPDVWTEPYRFDPARFLDAKPSPYAYLPFGGGVRRCIGMAFAMYEMRIILATALARFRFRPAPGVTITPERRSVTVGPSRNMPIVVERRSHLPK